jgi:hypothetical protein
MRLPSFKRLILESFEQQYQKLVEALSLSLNYGIELLYQALDKNITLRDNIKCTVKDITVNVNASGKPKISTTFNLDTNGKVDGIIVISALNQSNSALYPSSGIFISGLQSGQTFVVNNVTGLQADQNYLLRVVVFCQ